MVNTLFIIYEFILYFYIILFLYFYIFVFFIIDFFFFDFFQRAKGFNGSINITDFIISAHNFRHHILNSGQFQH